MKKDTYTDSWYLMYSSLPDLNWARLRAFASGRAEVFDCDGRTTSFANIEEAQLWLAEDEFRALETFDAEDEGEYGVKFIDVKPPQSRSDRELRSKMYVRVRKADSSAAALANMTSHSHDIGFQWPFEDAENIACITCSHVLEEQHPILRVTHDEDDGAWQFLCGQLHEPEQARVVCLGCMIVRDKQLASLADLPLGWCAERTRLGSAWVREQNQTESEHDEGAG